MSQPSEHLHTTVAVVVVSTTDTRVPVRVPVPLQSGVQWTTPTSATAPTLPLMATQSPKKLPLTSLLQTLTHACQAVNKLRNCNF